RAVAHYDGAAGVLSLQVFYGGLSGPPTAAALARAGGEVLVNLAEHAVGAPGVAGGYIAAVSIGEAEGADLAAGALAVVIGTAANPEGELRGRLAPSRGEGVVIGVLDTGIDPGHPSFSGQPADGHVYTNPLGRMLGVCDPGDARYDPRFGCNDKLIGAYSFADTAGTPDPQGRPSPHDNHGHGSHIAGIAAGNPVPDVAIGGADVGQVAGVAPHANLVVYDVCGIAGSGRSCSGSAILAAIDQAVADGVDLLNLSLSGSSRDPWLSADGRALLGAVGAGAFVAASAGNGGPGAGTIGSPANAPWVAAAGSVSHASVLDPSSARGPDRSAPALLKPDLAAPGVEIIAAGADANPAAADYLQLSGTSMAAAQTSGLAALLREIHSGWSPAEIRSALALTGATARTADGAPAGPFAQGGGRIAPGAAALAGFVLDVDEAAYRAADPARGGDPARLNLPALIDPGCVGGCVFTRTLRSTLGVPVTWAIEGGGDGFTVTARPPGPLTLGPGATATITFTAAVTEPRPGATAFGGVRLTALGDLAPPATLPVAIPLERSNLPGAIAIASRGRSGSRAVALRAMAISRLAVTASRLGRLRVEHVELGQDPTPGDRGDLAAGGIYTRSVTLPAGNLRFRAQLDRATAANLDLVVYVDRSGAGFGRLGPEDTVLCERTGPGSAELCDIVAPNLVTGRAEPVEVTVLVQNLRGSGADRDSFRLLLGSAGLDDGAGTLVASGPAVVPAGQPFELRLGWDVPGARDGEIYIGAVSLGSSPARPGDLGSALVTVEIGAERSYLPAIGR
ncbi:MAG TPA: S8 family serine peptidase, partial [Chloroflexaceae bacterium]|nr:S8 family serine peptidase [Chloroflexaceae bacterium]